MAAWIRRLAEWSESVAVVAVWIMLAFTVVDVVGAKVFLKPLRGATDLVGFAQVIAIAAGLAMSFFAGRQIELEFVVAKFPRLLQRLTQGVISLLGLGLFATLAWQSFAYGRSLQRAGQMSSAIDIPFYPFAYILGFFMAVAALYFVVELLEVIRGSAEVEHDPR